MKIGDGYQVLDDIWAEIVKIGNHSFLNKKNMIFQPKEQELYTDTTFT